MAAFVSIRPAGWRVIAGMSALVWVVWTGVVSAQAAQEPNEPNSVFVHPDTDRYWLSGQMNVIFQTHPAFPAPYSGEHSLRPAAERATSTLLTLYTGVRIPGNLELMLAVESAGGRGISDTLGLAGFTNLDVVRNPTLGAAPYMARVTVHRTAALGAEPMPADPNVVRVTRPVPVPRNARAV